MFMEINVIELNDTSIDQNGNCIMVNQSIYLDLNINKIIYAYTRRSDGNVSLHLDSGARAIVISQQEWMRIKLAMELLK